MSIFKISGVANGQERKRWRWPIALALAAAALAAACDVGHKPAEKATSSKAVPPRRVQVEKVSEQQLERSVMALGSLVAHEKATLSAKVAGRVQTLHVDVGATVKKGSPLAQIEPRDYELKVRQALAALSQARAVLGLPIEGDNDQIDPENTSAVKGARAVLDESKANLNRVKQLSQQKIVSESEVDTAQSGYLVALNRCADAQETARQQQAMVAQRRAEYEIAKQQLADTVLTAPFDGGIQERKADVGEYLIVGAPVITVVKLEPLRLRVEVSERDAGRVRLGQLMRFTVEGNTNRFEGQVDRLSPALDENTRMLLVEADIRNEGRLHPGCFARAEIVTEPAARALTMPAEAIITFVGLEKAIVVQDGKALEKRITTGQRGKDWVEVLSGLKAGEAVVLNPGGLQNGNPVTAGEGPERVEAGDSRVTKK